jgi:hypothetical protein
MAYFVQHLSDEGVINNIFTELSTSYSTFLRKNDTDPVKENKVYPEVTEWINQATKLLSDSDSLGVFQLCYNARTKFLNPENLDGITPLHNLEYQRQIIGMLYLLNYCDESDSKDILPELNTLFKEMTSSCSMDFAFKMLGV